MCLYIYICRGSRVSLICFVKNILKIRLRSSTLTSCTVSGQCHDIYISTGDLLYNLHQAARINLSGECKLGNTVHLYYCLILRLIY